MRIVCDTLEAAVAQAESYSHQNPTVYVRIGAAFDIHLIVEKRLHVFAPSDTPWWLPDAWRGYWHNGKFRLFTLAQTIADQQATPTMA